MKPENDTGATEEAFSFIEYTASNVFITGKAGTGKTYFLTQVIVRTSKKHVVMAPTGVAAVNAKGVTINSFFQIPPGLFLPSPGTVAPGVYSMPDILDTLNYPTVKRDLLRELELIIIDEVSMMRCDQVEMINRILKKIRGNDRPFAGVQMVFIGDLFQLPPIVSNEFSSLFFKHYRTVFFFGSEVIRQNPFIQIEFTEVHRQTDDQFIGILNRIRTNTVTEGDLDILNAKYQSSLPAEDHIHITSHVLDASNINTKRLNDHPGTEHVFEATIKDNYPDTNYPAEKELRLKVGARVMMIRNDSNADRRFYNGKVGVVISIDEEVIHLRFDDASTLAVERAVWQSFDYLNGQLTPVGEFIQFPLRLAWAVTIHKSQGLTFDKAVIDAGKSFSSGQVYVALSRIKSLHGLVLTSHITTSSIRASAEIVAFMGSQADFDLQGALAKEKVTYWLSLLADRFSLASVLDSLSQILKKPDSYKQKIGVKAVNALEEIFNTVTELQNIYHKFRLELLGKATELIEASYLEGRMLKAVTYFTDRLQKEILPKINVSNRATAVDGRALTDDPFVLVKAKLERLENTMRQAPGIAVKFSYEGLEELILESRSTRLPEIPAENKGGSRSVAPRRKETLNRSLQISVDLLRSGKTVAEIARERNLSVSTVENHLLEAAKSGDPAAMALLPQETYEVIAEVISQSGVDLHEVADRLDGKFSFFEIRLALHLHSLSRRI